MIQMYSWCCVWVMLENLHPFKSVLLYTKRRANMQQLFASYIARRRWIASITPQGRVCESHTPFCCDVTESDQQSWLLSLQFMYRSKNSIDFQLPEHLNHANTIPLHSEPLDNALHKIHCFIFMPYMDSCVMWRKGGHCFYLSYAWCGQDKCILWGTTDWISALKVKIRIWKKNE